MTRWAPAALAALLWSAAGCGGKVANDRSAAWCLHPSLSTELSAVAVRAVEHWNERSGGEVTMGAMPGSHTEDGCTHEIKRASPPDARPSGRPPAAALRLRPNYGAAALEEIEIYVERSPAEMFVVIAHELGHHLTGPEHSEERADIMFSGGFSGQSELSPADVERLDWSEWRRRQDRP